MHFPQLIQDLALILCTAGVISLLFRWLNQPAVLGYLIAGTLVGPEFNYLPTVADVENIKTWSELGVIFLLFVLGLEFSFKKLLKVGKPSIIAATVEVGVMLLIGYALGQFLSWTPMSSIFLGSILAISSTTIIVKAFDDLGVKSQFFAQLTFGILVVEDLLAIILLAVLSSLAASTTLQGSDLILQVGKLFGFLAVIVPIGLFFTPRISHRLRNMINDESRVIISLALCLALVYLSHIAGASTALGAFLAGAFFAETMEGERVERLFKPIRDLFAAIFFVSIGMLVDLTALKNNLLLIAIITIITVIGKTLSTGIGVRLARQEKRVAIQTGLSMAQIGEFSFIIATLGVTLKVIPTDVYAIAVAVSVITTFTTPYLIRYAQTLPLERKARRTSSRTQASMPRLWDSHLAEFEIHPHFSQLGKTLKELALRERFGITIVSILRGEHLIISPVRDDRCMSYDRVTVIGTDSQLKRLGEYLKTERKNHNTLPHSAYVLEYVRVSEKSTFIDRTLRESGIREKVSGFVLGIERSSERILNPDSTETILADDILWIYGIRDQIKNLKLETDRA